MSPISLDNKVFNATVSKLTSYTNALTTTKKEFSGYESKAETLEKFVELYSELADVISTYKGLLLNDIEKLKNVGTQLNDADKQAAGYFK